MLGWLKLLVAPLVGLLRRPKDVAKVVESANAIVDAFRIPDPEPSQPLPYKAVENIRQQIDSATAHKVQPLPGPAKACTVPPVGWTCSRTAGHDGPCAASPAIDRTAKTPPPPRPPRISKKREH